MKTDKQKSVCFYFQVHQPYRLRDYNFFEENDQYFTGPKTAENRQIFEKVAQKCYLPANHLMLKLLKKYPNFKISFSLSGVFLEQCLEFGETGQQVLNSFQRLVQTGQVEILSETYYHSLSFLFSKLEFAEQIHLHRQLIKKLFNIEPTIFRNTELIYNNELANFIKQMGFKGMLLEGWDPLLGLNKAHFLMQPIKTFIHDADQKIANQYKIKTSQNSDQPFKLLLKDYRLSDDIAFRFGDRSNPEFPLTAEKFAHWLSKINGNTINLFMDYETFGEHQWPETGIFEFLEHLPRAVFTENITFRTPTETVNLFPAEIELDCHHHLSWADQERDLSAWTGNHLQDTALDAVKKIEPAIILLKQHAPEIAAPLLDAWRKLQTSDHFYYMCLKFWHDGDVHKYFSPYESPYEAFIAYMNVLTSLKSKIITALKTIKIEQYA